MEHINIDDSDTHNILIDNSVFGAHDITQAKPIDNTNKPQDDDEPWNYKILLLLKKVGKKTMGYRWMHEQDAQYYDKMNTRFGTYEMLILAFLGTITGAGFVNFIAGTGLQDNKIVYIVITVTQLVTVFIAAIIKGYSNVNNYEKNKADHFLAALKNAELNLNIQYQLSLNIKDRDNDKLFLKNVVKNFNDILFLAPPIRESTKKRYMEESNDNDMFNPIIFDGDGLQIIVHDPTNETKNNIVLNQKTNIANDSKMKYQIDRWLQHF
ncbi:hypothetical protein QJ856_gp0647 [Tupanvirus deep ocean]|uniref:Uncharacterized protein n=2 Tax=Tupanvirus TaxID=2094720 RepID=A0AC62A910_9VIRU|nr:hypothetical protein QJ856_gp0647 [Tupanvirus deep ocean]QKU34103.1 hypothetical protein [Tupanvirus deep ocean]